MRLTVELLEAGMSKKGGWSRAQFELIGIDWPPKKGWKDIAVGREVGNSCIEKFLELKDSHLDKNKVD